MWWGASYVGGVGALETVTATTITEAMIEMNAIPRPITSAIAPMIIP